MLFNQLNVYAKDTKQTLSHITTNQTNFYNYGQKVANEYKSNGVGSIW